MQSEDSMSGRGDYIPTILPIPVPCGWGRGWATYDMTCSDCGHQWSEVCAVGTVGAKCPDCHFFDEKASWESHPQELANDGAWITGSLVGDF